MQSKDLKDSFRETKNLLQHFHDIVVGMIFVVEENDVIQLCDTLLTWL
jgi:hypothetical protein